MVLALFGALGLLAAVGYGYTSLIKGPAKGVQTITDRTTSEADVFTAGKILMATSRQSTTADCDNDSFMEPLPWEAPMGAPAPVGGGLIPSGTPAVRTDAWNTTFGYCAWDHGTVSVSDNNAGCGGNTALRRQGGNVKVEEVIAVISAGPDRIFQTSCSNYVNPTTPMVTRAAGSDDIFVTFTYAEGYDAKGSAGSGGLGEVEDSACTPDAVGLVRYQQEVVQVCMIDPGSGGSSGTPTVSWHEIGSEADMIPGFTPTIGAAVNTQYTSNTISFTGFFGTRLTTVDNGGTIILNGTPVGPSAQVKVGDTVAIRATSSAAFSTARNFTLNISSILRVWTLETAPPGPPVLVITPSVPPAMNVTGPGSPATGSSVQYTVTNTGESTSANLAAPALSNITNFEVVGTNNCSGNTLAPAATCTFWVRPRASNDGAYTSTLTISDGAVTSNTKNLSGTATGWSCTLDGQTVAHGASYTFFSATSHADCSTISQSRTCTSGTLNGSGTYQYANCITVINGQQMFTASGSLVVPAGVTSISAVCVGRGGSGYASSRHGGRGGDLRYAISLATTPGESLTVTIPATQGAGAATIMRGGTTLLSAASGAGTGSATTSGTSSTIGGNIGGGNGGNGGPSNYPGGGGAGGYSGNGGIGAGGGPNTNSPGAGSGGGGGGGSYAGGGGVGLLGQGANGSAGVNSCSSTGNGGRGGSGGGNAADGGTGSSGCPLPPSAGANYGGGGTYSGYSGAVSPGGAAACRIIWGAGRAYPSTNTADM